MNQQTENTLRAAEAAIDELLTDCRKGGAVYRTCPKAAAQVNRNAKWLRHGIATLRRELKSVSNNDGRQES
jgi:hypothetical protein